MANVDVRSINPDGTAILDDGREMQIVMSPSGALGMRPITVEDHVSALDQIGQPPPIKITGLDQVP